MTLSSHRRHAGRPGRAGRESARPEVPARLLEALAAYARGEAVDAIAARQPNLRRFRAPGLSASATVRMIRRAADFLAYAAMHGLRPEGLPDALWPPAEVLARMAGDGGLTNHARASRVMRRWIEDEREAAVRGT